MRRGAASGGGGAQALVGVDAILNNIYVNMPKNFTFHIIIILFYPGLVELGSLSYPGMFSILAVVAVNATSGFIINSMIGKQYYVLYYDLSQVSNFKYGRYYNCLWRVLARLMGKL